MIRFNNLQKMRFFFQIFLCFTPLLIAYLALLITGFSSEKAKEKMKPDNGWTIFLLIGGVIFSALFFNFFGTKTPGSEFEKNNYTVKFLALLSNEEHSDLASEAIIQASWKRHQVGDDDVAERQYQIILASIYEGNRISFRDSEPISADDFGKRIIIFDDSGKEWQIEVTEIRL